MIQECSSWLAGRTSKQAMDDMDNTVAPRPGLQCQEHCSPSPTPSPPSPTPHYHHPFAATLPVPEGWGPLSTPSCHLISIWLLSLEMPFITCQKCKAEDISVSHRSLLLVLAFLLFKWTHQSIYPRTILLDEPHSAPDFLFQIAACIRDHVCEYRCMWVTESTLTSISCHLVGDRISCLQLQKPV